MASKQQMTGMLGAYLAAAELTQRGLIVSMTSRNARGADLLVADQTREGVIADQIFARQHFSPGRPAPAQINSGISALRYRN
jgi:hypothetical protein